VVRRWLLPLCGLAWIAAVAAGTAMLANYAAREGHAAPPGDWPAETAIGLAPDRPTLVVFAHPQCPCSRASIGELARLLNACGDRVAVRVAFLKPEGFDDEWVRSDLWESAAAIPGVTVFSDDGGAESRRFGAFTSGQALLYDADGHILFRGGITHSRGHEGDNAGSRAIADLVAGRPAEAARAPVFGCSLGDGPAEAGGAGAAWQR
jgi:hypothetical protein